MSNLNRFLSKWSILPEYQDAGLVIDPSKLSREQYQKLYDEGRVATYDKAADVYQPPILPEVSISAEAPKSVTDFGRRFRKKLQEDNPSLAAQLFKLPVEAVAGLPQAAFTYLLDPEKNIVPSQALDVQNPYAAMAVDVVTDPINLVGAGVADDVLKVSGKLGKAGSKAGKYLTTETPVRNAYKYNPFSVKENPEMYLYRARPKGQDLDMNMAAQLKAKESTGQELKWWQKNITNTTESNSQLKAREKYYGRWFEKDPNRLDFYIDSGTSNFAEDDVIEILRTRLPKEEASKLNVSQFEDAKSLSASPETEFILPKETIGSAESFSVDDLNRLVEEDKVFNTPNWLTGYKQVPINKKQQGGLISKLGYKKNSPYKDSPFLEIDSNHITMDGVDQPLILIPEVGKPVIAKPNSGDYIFPNSQSVTEVPLSKLGGFLQKYKLGGCMECGGMVKAQEGGKVQSFKNKWLK